MVNKESFSNLSDELTFHGNFNKNIDQPNILLLLPRTRGPIGIKKFKDEIEKNFNLVEYDDVLSEKSKIFNQLEIISLKQKALAINKALKKWKKIEYHIICHSTGCGLGTFLAKANKKACKSLVFISPWNKKDKDFKSAQEKRVENAKRLDVISFLKSECDLLYSANYLDKFQNQFCCYILNQKNKKVNPSFIEKRLNSILDCNLGNELRNLDIPKLIINTIDDKLMKIHHGKELHKICTNSKLISLKSGGHMLTETRAEDISKYINSFINSMVK